MKRLFAAAIALSMLAVPAAEAQQRYQQHRPAPHYVHPKVEKKVVHKEVVKKKVVKRPAWKRGNRFSEWRRYQAVRDYHRYGLRRPAPGQQWIRVGNEFILVGVATGIIAGIIAASR
ncbi:RcnB family protein [Rhodoligotrophos ferricapiens]|uniref:RcnB family protein n=1 Tax=Rhodoligotrophos ferricapiens TaxID=3069264 RepID=UPI00315D27B9